MKPHQYPLKVLLGAGDQRWDGWTATQREDLDLLSRPSFERWFAGRRAQAFLCEHVWEHFTEEEGLQAARLCFDFLEPGGFLRCAVPDGQFPDAEYQRVVQVGGPGPSDHPAADHKVVYTAPRLLRLFEQAGFEVRLLEYCDAAGQFHAQPWDLESGPVYRSRRLDHRNRGSYGFRKILL